MRLTLVLYKLQALFLLDLESPQLTMAQAEKDENGLSEEIKVLLRA